MMEESASDHLYTEEWTEEFQREADVDLVVEGVTLEVHSTILCQSKVLYGAIRDTKNRSGRVRIESLFEGTTVEDVDMLLSELYSTSQTLLPHELDRFKRLINIAMKCGFDGLVKKVLGTLTMSDSDSPESDFLWHLRSEWRDEDPDSLTYWLNICSATSHTKLEDELSNVLATSRFFFISGREWKPIRENLLGNPRLMLKILGRTARILKRNLHEPSLPASHFHKLRKILEGET
ncbi:hypothetical protein BSKO_11025 [Bryopsis sp. KO-2023]|nr:hypothetical protein BSKO_11025 [Bryopsis sp. KO-2023]